MSLTMRSRVEVQVDGRWREGRIIGIFYADEGVGKYDVALDRPFGEAQSVFARRACELRLIQEAASIKDIQISIETWGSGGAHDAR